MKTFSAKLILSTILLLPAGLSAQYTEGTIDMPNSSSVVPNGIDSTNQVVGTYWTSDGVSHGFVYSGGVKAQIDLDGGVTPTFIYGINSTAGMVGAAYSGGYEGVKDGKRSIRLVNNPAGRVVTGINTAGTFVGFWETASSLRGFENVNGAYLDVVPPACASRSQSYTIVNAINTNGDLVGYCTAADNSQHGFARIGGVYQDFSYPGAVTYPTGINDSGTIVGYYYLPNTPVGSFIYSNGVFTQFAYQGGSSSYSGTTLYGINNRGSLVGTVVDNNLVQTLGFYAFAN